MNNETNKTGAYILIGLGAFFLLSQLGFSIDFNWWAIFIALPGFVMLRNVYGAYSAKSGLNSNEIVQGVIGLILLSTAGAFLLNIDLDFMRNLIPLALIVVGVLMLLGRDRG